MKLYLVVLIQRQNLLALALSAPAFTQSKNVFSKFVAFRPVKESLQPKVAKRTAVPAPIPDEAPEKN